MSDQDDQNNQEDQSNPFDAWIQHPTFGVSTDCFDSPSVANPSQNDTGDSAPWTFDPIDHSKTPSSLIDLPPELNLPPYAKYGRPGDPPPATNSDSDDANSGGDSDPSGVVEIDSEGIGVSAKLKVESDLLGTVQLPEFTVHLGPKGELKQLELDLEILKKKIEKLGALSRVVQLEATLSLNATSDLDQTQTQTIFKGVQGQVKGELEAHFLTVDVPLLQKIAFKMTATAGTGGVSVSGSIEIPIPGT
jgi:hypothetical protein